MPLLTDEERVGTTLNDRYKLTSIIGSGGMGTVFRGVHMRTQRLVAVKFLHPEFARANDVVNRFVREAQAAAALRHPNVIDILDMDWDQGGFYLVMEFLEGESLEERIAGNAAPLTEDEALQVMLPVMDALGKAHALNIVHRDIKPDNILLSVDGSGAVVPKLLDFGVAKLLSDQTQSRTRHGALIGTPQYMSPEQVAGTEFVDSRSDIWAVGVVLYECLTGTPPFMGEHPMALCMRLLNETVPPIRERASGELSGHVADAIDRALRKDPSARFNCMWEFIAALTGETRRTLVGSTPALAIRPWAPPRTLTAMQVDVERLASCLPREPQGARYDDTLANVANVAERPTEPDSLAANDCAPRPLSMTGFGTFTQLPQRWSLLALCCMALGVAWLWWPSQFEQSATDPWAQGSNLRGSTVRWLHLPALTVQGTRAEGKALAGAMAQRAQTDKSTRSTVGLAGADGDGGHGKPKPAAVHSGQSGSTGSSTPASPPRLLTDF